MKRFSAAFKKLLCPHGLLLALLALLSAAGLLAVFTEAVDSPPVAYASYFLSAYATACLTLRAIRLAKRGKALLHRNPFLHRCLTDLEYRAELSLRLSLCVNLLYSVFKAAAGIYYRSPWFGAAAFYYMSLSTVRFLLLRSAREKERTPKQALRAYRRSGGVLLMLTLPVAAMGLHAVYGGKAMEYPGYMIYAVAGYTFYILGVAISNFLRYRKLQDPVCSAGKAISLAAALVSLFSLQTALLAAFGGGDAALQRSLNLCTGIAVFALVAAMAVHMLTESTRALRALSDEPGPPEAGSENGPE